MSDLLFAVTQQSSGRFQPPLAFRSLRFTRPLRRSPCLPLAGHWGSVREPAVNSRLAPRSEGMPERSWRISKSKRFWRCRSKGSRAQRRNMMSAIETGISGYRPAQLLNWVYMSLQDSQGVAYDASRAESDTSPLDTNVSKHSAADLSSNYFNKFFHLRSEVQFHAVIHMQDNVQL